MPAGRVPVSASDAPSPAGALQPAQAAPTPSADVQSQRPESIPDVRGPSDPWHSEAYLIGWLVKLYGWYVLEPGVLRRRWRPRPEVAAAWPPPAPPVVVRTKNDQKEAA